VVNSNLCLEQPALSGKKACYMSKVLEFCAEKAWNLHVSAMKYSFLSLTYQHTNRSTLYLLPSCCLLSYWRHSWLFCVAINENFVCYCYHSFCALFLIMLIYVNYIVPVMFYYFRLNCFRLVIFIVLIFANYIRHAMLIYGILGKWC